MTGKEVMKLLQQHGWVLDRSNRHPVMVKNGEHIPVPMHGKRDIPLGTLHAILKKAGLK